jgi:hypothetical protein
MDDIQQLKLLAGIGNRGNRAVMQEYEEAKDSLVVI